MVEIVEQLCIKSYYIGSKSGDYFECKQGEIYTTTKPNKTKKDITVFSKYWIHVPKENFVPLE